MAETPCLLGPLVQSTRLGGLEGDATLILIHVSHFVNRWSGGILPELSYYSAYTIQFTFIYRTNRTLISQRCDHQIHPWTCK